MRADMTEQDNLNLLWLDSPFFDRQLEQLDLPSAMKSKIKFFAENGYLIFDPEMPADLLDRVTADVIAYEGPERQGDGRILQGWIRSKTIATVATWEKVIELLRVLYRREPIPFQTLNFTRGTEQATHSDTVHFQSYPANFMCGVWVALEDIGPNNGPLHYYVGSHKLPLYDLFDFGLDVDKGDYRNYVVYTDFLRDMLEARGLKREEVRVPKGRALLWAANLMHGGSPIIDPNSTRHSQVTHYYFEKCAYYTPMLSRPMIGKIHWRLDLRDIRTGEGVQHYYLGQPFDPTGQASSGTGDKS
jgi:hypothetical protein